MSYERSFLFALEPTPLWLRLFGKPAYRRRVSLNGGPVGFWVYETNH